MIKGDVVEIMIALPAQLFLNTQIPCCLWFLTNDKTKNGEIEEMKLFLLMQEIKARCLIEQLKF